MDESEIPYGGYLHNIVNELRRISDALELIATTLVVTADGGNTGDLQIDLSDMFTTLSKGEWFPTTKAMGL